MNSLTQRDFQSIWHPYSHPYSSNPLLEIERADGLYLFDTCGNRYIDGIASWWVNIHGHNHPILNQALKEQIEKMAHVIFAGVTHYPAVELAEGLLNAIGNGFSKVFYSDNGSTAVEVAAKVVYQHWVDLGLPQKNQFIKLKQSYHGDTFGTMSIGESPSFHQIFQSFFFKTHAITNPNCIHCELNLTYPSCQIQCINALSELVKTDKDQIAGLIIEPLIMGAGGMIMYPHEFLTQCSKICFENDIPWIADEVFTGFGRTGAMYASTQLEHPPPAICLSKGITSGYMPLGATVFHQNLLTSFAKKDLSAILCHGHSYTANPLACAVGLASLKLFSQENTMKKVAQIAFQFESWKIQFKKLPLIKDVRSRGAVMAWELSVTEEEQGYHHPIGQIICKSLLKQGIFLRPLGNILYFIPPYCITTDEIDFVMSTLLQILSQPLINEP